MGGRLRSVVIAMALAMSVAAAGCSGGGSRSSVSAGATGVAPPTTIAPTPIAPGPTTTVAAITTDTGAGGTASTSTTSSASLQTVVDAYAARQPVPFSVVAVDERTGERAARLADRQVWSASLYKLFVARELLHRIIGGSVDRGQKIGDDEGRTVGQCLTAMIVVSDDDCGVAGLAMVGTGALDATLHADGYTHTALDSPQRTSASDVALFFERVRAGTLLGDGDAERAATAELHDLLARQQVNDRFPTALPAGTPMAHKTGDRTGWAHDAGIIGAPRGEVLLVVLTGQWASPCCHAERPGAAERAAFAAIAGMARQVYGYVDRAP